MFGKWLQCTVQLSRFIAEAEQNRLLVVPPLRLRYLRRLRDHEKTCVVFGLILNRIQKDFATPHFGGAPAGDRRTSRVAISDHYLYGACGVENRNGFNQRS